MTAHRYRAFWHGVGETFPDLAGARSTQQYRADEKWLLRTLLGDLQDLRLLKTDLWDECKNTRILQWAAGEGAVALGIDLSPPIVRDAGARFAEDGLALRATVADVRAIPLRDGTVDAVYSMGTIEHFEETQHALTEIYRVLRPGGRAVVGVPNRRDPFLRPAFVALLHALGRYGYGYEKSYSRRTLRRMLERAGFEIGAETGILFLPGWLRMAELACHAWLPRLRPASSLAVAPFAALSAQFPGLRRHGYLLAALGRKPC